MIESVVFEALLHVGLNALQERTHPAVGLAKVHIAVEGFSGRTLCLGVGVQATVLSFAIHEHKASGVPQFIAKIAIAFASFGVKVDAAPQ